MIITRVVLNHHMFRINHIIKKLKHVLVYPTSHDVFIYVRVSLVSVRIHLKSKSMTFYTFQTIFNLVMKVFKVFIYFGLRILHLNKQFCVSI